MATSTLTVKRPIFMRLGKFKSTAITLVDSNQYAAKRHHYSSWPFSIYFTRNTSSLSPPSLSPSLPPSLPLPPFLPSSPPLPSTVLYELLTRQFPFSVDKLGFPLDAKEVIFRVGRGERQEFHSREVPKKFKVRSTFLYCGERTMY